MKSLLAVLLGFYEPLLNDARCALQALEGVFNIDYELFYFFGLESACIKGRSTQELDQFILPFHRLDLRLILSLVLFDPGPASVLGRPLEDLPIMHGVLRKLATMGLLAMVIERRIGMVKLPARAISAFVQINLPIFFTYFSTGITLDFQLEVEVLALALELVLVVGTLGVASPRHKSDILW